MLYDNMKNLNILYIEDDEVLSSNFRLLFQKLGATVFYAVDYDDAIEQYEKYNLQINIVITDIKLNAGYSGFDLIAYIRRKNSSIPIFVTTAYPEQENLLLALELDVNKVFIKPFKEALMFETLNKVASMIVSQNVQTIDAKKLEKESLNIVYLSNGYIYSRDIKCVVYEGMDIKLTYNEITFIELLIENSTRIVTYDEIQHKLYEKSKKYVNLATLRTMVKNIRRKTHYSLIGSLSNIGYKIN